MDFHGNNVHQVGFANPADFSSGISSGDIDNDARDELFDLH